MTQVSINIIDKDYIDSLIVALVRQGYDVFYNSDDNVVGFNTLDSELTAIKYEKIVLNDA
jgi:hypothetical protein